MTGDPFPRLGFGTFGRTGPAGTEAILCALETGYRHLDTAQSYDTEREVGEAVRRSGLPRGEVFVTTKVAQANFGAGPAGPLARGEPRPPRARPGGPDADPLALGARGGAARGCTSASSPRRRRAGSTRLIGVSNFPIALIEEARALLGDGEIATNQVELNPWHQNRKLADHCMAPGSWSPATCRSRGGGSAATR